MAAAVLRPVLIGVLVVAWYFNSPMDNVSGAAMAFELAGGLLLVGAVVAWQARAIARSAYPRWRAAGALALSFPLLIVLFSTAYFLLEAGVPGSFTSPLTRLDSLYFAVTVFTTVGFGDIAALSETARTVVTVQMLADLVYVGLLARVLLGAVQIGVRRRAEGATNPAPDASYPPRVRRNPGERGSVRADGDD